MSPDAGVQRISARLQQANIQLNDVNSLLTKARGIALQAPQVSDETERNVLAKELSGLLDQLGAIANAADDNGYLFSGTAANTRPFPDLSNSNGQLTYSGSQQGTQLHPAGDVDRMTLLPGSAVFQPVAREATVLIGTTGARSGTGTDTAAGTRTLLVSHTLTSYAAGAGISAGSSSVSGDTIIGPTGAHQIQINDTSGTGAFGTVSLNGGPPVSFSSADTDLLVTGANGEQIYVNTTAVTPGFNGSVDITADGAISIDGGATSTAIAFTANQIVTDGRDGTIVNLDTVSVNRAGTDELEFPGTADAFTVLKNLRDDLLNTRSLDASALTAALNRRLADVERMQDHVLDIVGVHSVGLEHLDRLEIRTGDLKLAEKSAHSDTVSADIGESVLRLQELNNLQQFTMAAVGQLLTPNLLNYLQ